MTIHKKRIPSSRVTKVPIEEAYQEARLPGHQVPIEEDLKCELLHLTETKLPGHQGPNRGGLSRSQAPGSPMVPIEEAHV